MSKNAENSSLKKITILVNKECWKELKINSIRKETSLSEFTAEVLEKYTSKLKESK
jgi:hypothetical protein